VAQGGVVVSTNPIEMQMMHNACQQCSCCQLPWHNYHFTHHAMFPNSAWLCSTVGEHGKTLITT
jgi:hypothetical protein